jgi:choice-of-anchor B domain-containing protein
MAPLNIATLMVGLAALSSAKELVVDMKLKAELYDPGLVHGRIMATKEQQWSEMARQGVFDSAQYGTFSDETDYVACVDGTAALIPGDPVNTFRCQDLDLFDFRTHAQLGSSYGRGAGSWGWTSPQGREFVAIAQQDGTAFAEVSAKGKLIYLGRLPQYDAAPISLWREIKGYKSYILIGSEAEHHGVQIFDLSKLLEVNSSSPVVFNNQEHLTGFWVEGLPLGRSHNVVTNEELNYGVATGFQPRDGPLGAGLVFFDLTDPSNPRTLGGTGADGYVHDAQCIVYRGPDEKYNGRDICYGYDEDSLTIFDVSDKQNIKVISNTSYEGFVYTHQGWVLDPQWQQYLITDDEYDEVDKSGLAADGYPISYIWDISSLEAPKQTGHYKGLRKGIDHNQFVKDGFSYQSNYGLGLSILDLRSVPSDPTGKGIREVAFFDTHPEDDHLPGGGNVTFTGSWSHYPFFPSGFIVINTMDRGAFVVKRSAQH